MPHLPTASLGAGTDATRRRIALAGFGMNLGHLVYGVREARFCNQYSMDIFAEPLISVPNVAAAVLRTLLATGGDWRRSPQVAISFDMYPSFFPAFYEKGTGVVPLPEQDERCLGEHAALAYQLVPVGNDPIAHIRFAHRMGTYHAQPRDGYVSLQYLEHHLREAYIRQTRDGPLDEARNQHVIHDYGDSRSVLVGARDARHRTDHAP